MQLPKGVGIGVSELLGQGGRTPVHITDFSSASGGCINQGGIVGTSLGIFFVKWNDAGQFPGMFDAEAKGLQLLASTGTVRVPSVMGVTQIGKYQILLMECATPVSPKKDYWEKLGQQLAGLHKSRHHHFGLDHENYIGSLRQRNDWKSSWVDFFISERLDAQMKIGVDSGALPSDVTEGLNALYTNLPSLLAPEQPSLVHGDLWSGNLINDQGNPCLIDPAVYFGHREVDLAMTQLFGGFDEAFYEAYLEAFPCKAGLQERLAIYQLYPLLVHLNLFGSGYLRGIRSILARYR